MPRLDSLTFRLFRERWPGLQAPQHTVLFTKEMLLKFIDRAELELVEYLPYGAFPPYFYLFAGVAFKILKGKGLNLGRAIYPYFLGQILLSPVLAVRAPIESGHADRHLPEACVTHSPYGETRPDVRTPRPPAALGCEAAHCAGDRRRARSSCAWESRPCSWSAC